MAKILIVEDDEFLREILRDYLKSKGHEPVEVPNGKVAKDVALVAGFDLIISDIQTPYLNGVELLQWLRPQSQMPFILMTGFTNLLETKKAAELGAQGFLAKPFSNQDLLQIVESVLKPPVSLTPEEVDKLEGQYCKVSIDEFVARPKNDFDIFVRLQCGRYLKVAHLSETLDIQRLKNYKAKGISHLHIRKEDFGKLIDFNFQVSTLLQTSAKIPEEKKLSFARYSAEVILERCYVAEMDREAFTDAQQFVESSLNVITNNPQAMDLISLLNDHSDYLYAHCLAVSVYSVMIARKLNYISSQTNFKLAMAGLFHDIGKKEIERDLLNKHRPLMTVLERKVIESHVQRGREIMESIPGIPSDVIQMIYEHHEDEVGQGYPCAPPKVRLHPLSRIIYVADQFATRALKSPNSPGISAAAAIAHMEKFDIERMNKNVFAALKDLAMEKKAA